MYCRLTGKVVTENLQFIHIEKTKVIGRGRGSWKRYYDVKNNPYSYRLVCEEHHIWLGGPENKNKMKNKRDN